MIRKILTIPKDEKLLRSLSKDVTAFDKSLVDLVSDLSQTLEAQADPPGLGLSAPQIGVFKRVFVARIRNRQSLSSNRQSLSSNRIKAFVNAQITKFSKKEVAYLEGCFSVPNLYGHVVRAAEVDLESCDLRGKTSKTHYKGLPSRIIQHEIDHLNGALFIDHIHTQNGKVFRVEKDRRGKEQFVEVPLG